MKTVLYFTFFFTISYADISLNDTNPEFTTTSAYQYIRRIGMPAAKRIKLLEEIFRKNQSDNFRIVGGRGAALGQFPWQTGLIGDVMGSEQNVVCGGSLISDNRVLTAAHCWHDGESQVWRYTAVLGSLTLTYGGIRITTTQVYTHPNWVPQQLMNDLAMMLLPYNVPFSQIIYPISLPRMQNANWVGTVLAVSGYGTVRFQTAISHYQSLSFLYVQVIPNQMCWNIWPTFINDLKMCTSGAGGQNPCRGDSGGPLSLITEEGASLVGVVSFGSHHGCDVGLPAVYTRVDKYLDFIYSYIDDDI